MQEAADFRAAEELVKFHSQDQRIVIVDNYTSLLFAFRTLSTAQSLGVDLEGRLSIGGNINLIQVAGDTHIFIFDVYSINVISKDENLLQLLSETLKVIFLDPNIRKVFFDGKKDIEALHFILGVGVRNVIDTQVIHMALTQIQEFKKNKKLFELKNLVTPGLNDVLSKHEVTHGVNTLKDKFKKIFNDYKQCQHYFTTRPLDEEFASYSAQDVEDLSELADLMMAKLDSNLEMDVSPEYSSILIQQLSDTYANRSCQKHFELN